ncbi:hypothetical protein [Paenibacillus flagellatus]|uniref:Uncharacterized protein n=1 Tax=Paenibacillus flagellatus TaxID=2211139 RepID=A0A2V5K592_9BACL|nr:hypothetical protein [Paenibacillus flagellatus]PYI54529.1 hypothetical protein DLM86_13790 [Paenibacillus flagellatus]
MNRTASVFRMNARDKLSWFYIPWLILGISFAINLVIGYLLSEENGMYTGGIASIYVYMFVMGLIVLAQTFPFALGLGVRRTDYFWGTTATGGAVSALFAVILIALGAMERHLTGGWGVNLHFFHLPYLNDGPIVAQLWVSFALLMHVFFSGFVIASLYRRFGKTGLYVLFAVLLLGGSVGSYLLTYYGKWIAVFGSLFDRSASELAVWLFAIAAAYALASYRLLRRATA